MRTPDDVEVHLGKGSAVLVGTLLAGSLGLSAGVALALLAASLLW